MCVGCFKNPIEMNIIAQQNRESCLTFKLTSGEPDGRKL